MELEYIIDNNIMTKYDFFNREKWKYDEALLYWNLNFLFEFKR